MISEIIKIIDWPDIILTKLTCDRSLLVNAPDSIDQVYIIYASKLAVHQRMNLYLYRMKGIHFV